MVNPSETWVIVAGAGRGRRFGGRWAKQFVVLEGQTLLQHTLRALWASDLIDGFVVVVPPQRVAQDDVLPDSMRAMKQVIVCAGKDSRAESVLQGFSHIPVSCDVVLIHDAVRPNISRGLILRVRDGARLHGACSPVLTPTETVYRLDKHGSVQETPSRAKLGLAQTPQGFQRQILARSYDQALQQGLPPTWTDEASLVQACGQTVQTISGEQSNIKVTREEDMQAIQPRGPGVPRVGFGYDLHRLQVGRKLKLAGVEIEYQQGLVGHSDGDVAIHALCDAILGAAGLPDIGQQFPDSEPAYRGVDSLWLLQQVMHKAEQAGFCLSSADLTIVCEKPRLAEYRQAMLHKLAQVTGLPEQAIGIKATTEEGVGRTGQESVICAYAVAVLCSDPHVSTTL